MPQTEPSAAPGRFEVRVTADSHFAWIRTRLALERTMLSWVRTAVSLIGFGFAIVQFLQHVQHLPGALPAAHPEAPRYLGLALIAAGIASLLVSLSQYWWTVRYLRSDPYAPIAGMTQEGKHSPLAAVAILLTAIGIFAFMAVLLRIA
ncbi:YidH family protein [Neoroseomonas terrae]